MEVRSDHKFTIQILMGMALGIFCGVMYHAYGGGLPSVFARAGWLDSLGQMFMRLIKMLVLPIVFVSLICGASELKNMSDMGRIGIKTLVLYLITTALAVTMALLIASALKVGVGSHAIPNQDLGPLPTLKGDIETVPQTLMKFIPDNIFKSFYASDMLQVVVFALFFGMVLPFCGKAGDSITEFFQSLNEILIKCMRVVIRLAPLGVFFLLAYNFAHIDTENILVLLTYCLVLVGVLLLQLVFVYSGMLWLFTRLNPVIFLKKMFSPMLFAFGVSSSSASIPVVLAAVKNRLGVHNRVASFVIPIGATINMDGTAIMQGVATVFIANFLGVHLSMHDYLIVIMMATLASVGTAAVPSAGIFTLMMVLQKIMPNQPGIDLGVMMIFAVDRLLDMLRTAVNVAGDSMVACVVARTENCMDEEVYNRELEK